jgi:succinyl-diaminopimelate desuccinylase
VNAIHQAMDAALKTGLLSEQDGKIISFLKRVNDDYLGTALNIAGSDEVSGYTTCVGSMAWLDEAGRAVLHLNIRYCISADSDKLMANIREICEANGCELVQAQDSKPNYFPRENPVVDAVTDVFREITGKDREPYVMGGGTYARKLKNAMGFGMGGLEREATKLFAAGHGGAHQPDEGLHLANLKKAMLIFGMGILAADRALEN